MPIRFDTENSRRRAPNYRSRSLQFRLFLLLAGLMIVLFVISNSVDPYWRELVGLAERRIAGGPGLTARELSDAEVDTRLPAVARDSSEMPSVAGPDAGRLPVLPEQPTAVESPIERAWLHGWQTLFEKLDSADRGILFQGLRAVRHRQPVDPEPWQAMVAKLDRLWADYQAQAFDPLTSLPEDERDGWRIVLDHVERRWTDDWRPRLERWANPEELDEPSRMFANELQRLLDPCALAAVRDDALISRAPEREIWFRLFEQLAESSLDELRKQSSGPTGYLQLYDQPRSNRGRVVTVRGVVHQAYYLPELPPRPGVDGYYVFTLRPAGGPARPIIVYALELPPGFPAVGALAQTGQPTKLHEEVEFTGYFLKRMPYLAQDGVNRAPLVLARMPAWDRPSLSPISSGIFSTKEIVVALGLAAVAGISFAVWAFRNSPGAAVGRHSGKSLPDRIDPIA